MQSSFKTFAQQLMSEFETKVEFEPNAENRVRAVHAIVLKLENASLAQKQNCETWDTVLVACANVLKHVVLNLGVQGHDSNQVAIEKKAEAYAVYRELQLIRNQVATSRANRLARELAPPLSSIPHTMPEGVDPFLKLLQYLIHLEQRPDPKDAPKRKEAVEKLLTLLALSRVEMEDRAKSRDAQHMDLIRAVVACLSNELEFNPDVIELFHLGMSHITPKEYSEFVAETFPNICQRAHKAVSTPDRAGIADLKSDLATLQRWGTKLRIDLNASKFGRPPADKATILWLEHAGQILQAVLRFVEWELQHMGHIKGEETKSSSSAYQSYNAVQQEAMKVPLWRAGKGVDFKHINR